MADVSPSDICSNDAVDHIIQLKLQNYFKDEQPMLGGDGKAAYSTAQKIYVCAINWQTSAQKGRLIFTVRLDPLQVEIYKLLAVNSTPTM